MFLYIFYSSHSSALALCFLLQRRSAKVVWLGLLMTISLIKLAISAKKNKNKNKLEINQIKQIVYIHTHRNSYVEHSIDGCALCVVLISATAYTLHISHRISNKHTCTYTENIENICKFVQFAHLPIHTQRLRFGAHKKQKKKHVCVSASFINVNYGNFSLFNCALLMSVCLLTQRCSKSNSSKK